MATSREIAQITWKKILLLNKILNSTQMYENSYYISKYATHQLIADGPQ